MFTPSAKNLRIPGKPASHSRGNRPPSGAKRRWVVIRSVMVAGFDQHSRRVKELSSMEAGWPRRPRRLPSRRFGRRWTPRSREAMEANHNTEVSNIRGPRAHARRLRSRINHVSSDSLTGPFVEGQFQSRSPRGLNLVRLKARDLHSPNSDAAVNGHKRVRPLLPANRSSDAPTLATSSGPEGRKQSGAHAPKRQVPRKGSNGEDRRSMDS